MLADHSIAHARMARLRSALSKSSTLNARSVTCQLFKQARLSAVHPSWVFPADVRPRFHFVFFAVTSDLSRH